MKKFLNYTEDLHSRGYKIGWETKQEKTKDGYKITSIPKLEKILSPSQKDGFILEK